MKKKLLLILFLSIVAVSVLPNMALAQTITGILVNITKVVWIVATAIVIIFWVITGVLFLASQGDASKLSTAKNSLFAAIAGTILVILAYSARVILENAILQGV